MANPLMSPSEIKVPPLLANTLAATPAPMLWRALALALDYVLAGTIATILLTTVVFPQSYPNAQTVIENQFQSIEAAFQEEQATGKMPDIVISQDYLDLTVPATNTLFMVLLVYFAGSEILLGGTTLGKRVFSLRTARFWTTERATWIESLVRNIFKAASLTILWLLPVNLIVVFFRPSRRAIHDYLARTLVTGDAAPPLPVENDEAS